ncbi:radical SAM protein [Chlorobium sp. BLA1]|uniref:radical SAM protein n=1 Tax=Candidatus Chlorobium masyuteum TaxID=2716876 RepID=UPI0014229F81|nr:radical SAM protein [Candidatus Chlorobium masyuteum]NHQ59666.1 radical SAM protein [Candidatus Chlorobium masyuteum]
MNGVNSIVGWQYPETTIRMLLGSEAPRLLTIDFDFPCTSSCDLKCKYCFVETDERERVGIVTKPQGKLNVSQMKRVFADASALGCKSAKLVGDQEPLQEKALLDFLEYASEQLGMWIVMFTNGFVLANEAKCYRIHGLSSRALIERLKGLRVSIMLKFHSFDEKVEDALVGVPGYAAKRNKVLDCLIEAGFNEVPTFRTAKEKLLMTGFAHGEAAEPWTRLGLESVITQPCVQDVERIYQLKATKRLYVDLDPAVPVGLTRSAEWRKRLGIDIPKEEILEIALRLYAMNKQLGIPFQGASPYFGGLPCSQLPYGLYINAQGRIYPCCGCPEIQQDGSIENLGDVFAPGALKRAIEMNPYRRHYVKHGFAYDSAPFNSPDYPGYGIYHGCPFRDRAGDILPPKWEMVVAEFLDHHQGDHATFQDSTCNSNE